MKVTGLDGRLHNWNLGGHSPLGSDSRPRSAPHLRARALLEQLYPAEPRLEEVPLPGSGSLSADFYLPGRKLLVEVHGEQHYRFTPHFHENRLAFAFSQQRDRNKVAWCELNGITLVELPSHECDSTWTRRLQNATAPDDAGPG